MKLDISERLTLVNVIPAKGNFETMSTVEALQTILYPSEEEVKKFEIKQTETRIEWNEEGKIPVDVNFTERQVQLLKDQLELLSKHEELTMPQYLLIKKFREIN